MRDLPNTRQSLILRLKTSSDDAWSEFLNIYEGVIVRFCHSRGLQDADARDVTQEVLAALHVKIETWNPEADRGSFRAWLFRVARNIAIDRIRARGKKPLEVDEVALADVAQTRENEASAFLFEYRRALFAWASDQVSSEVQPVTWKCFWMTAVQDGDPSDVAKSLNVSVGTVYTAKCRVVARIREKIARIPDEEEITLLNEGQIVAHMSVIKTATRSIETKGK